MGDPLGTSGFVVFLEKLKNECNVHQSAPNFRRKIRSRTKKCANQNGRPGRSLKSKKKQKKSPTQKGRKDTDTMWKNKKNARICVISPEKCVFNTKTFQDPDIPQRRI